MKSQRKKSHARTNSFLFLLDYGNWNQRKSGITKCTVILISCKQAHFRNVGADSICLMMNKYGTVWECVHKVIHNVIKHREYKECHCNVTVWSHHGWSNTAVLFQREVSLQRIWGRLFGSVSNMPGKELFWKTVLPLAVHLQKRCTQGCMSHLENYANGLPGEMLHRAPGMPHGVDTLSVFPFPTTTTCS